MYTVIASELKKGLRIGRGRIKNRRTRSPYGDQPSLDVKTCILLTANGHLEIGAYDFRADKDHARHRVGAKCDAEGFQVAAPYKILRDLVSTYDPEDHVNLSLDDSGNLIVSCENATAKIKTVDEYPEFTVPDLPPYKPRRVDVTLTAHVPTEKYGEYDQVNVNDMIIYDTPTPGLVINRRLITDGDYREDTGEWHFKQRSGWHITHEKSGLSLLSGDEKIRLKKQAWIAAHELGEVLDWTLDANEYPKYREQGRKAKEILAEYTS